MKILLGIEKTPMIRLLRAFKKRFLNERCTVSWCFRRPVLWLQLDAVIAIEHIPFCDRHARIADHMMKSGDIKVPMKHTYKGL